MSWQLRTVLERSHLTAYRLAQQLKGQMSENSVYALARGETQRVSFSTLGLLLWALEELTGQRFTAADLLEYTPVTIKTQEPSVFKKDPKRPAFQVQELKTLTYRSRQDRPVAARPSEDIVSELRDRAW